MTPMNNPSSIVPWRFMLIAAAVIGFFWPLAFIISPRAGALYTALAALAVGLFVSTLLPTGELLSFKKYMALSFVVGLVAEITAWITIPLFWCRLFSHSSFCTYPYEGGPTFPFAYISFGLYLFILLMIYLWQK